MEIDQAAKLRKELEDRIAGAIEHFTARTGLSVVQVDVSSSTIEHLDHGQKVSRGYRVRIDVSLT